MKFEFFHRELVQSTEMIRALLAGVTPDEARLKPDPQSWSILEVTCHLYDEEREDFREHLDFILHRQNDQWHRIDPAAWVIERKYNEQDFEAITHRFFAERRQSLGWLKDLSTANWEIAYKSEFGVMSAGELFACWIVHDNLHVRQLAELRRFRIENYARPFSIEYAGEW